MLVESQSEIAGLVVKTKLLFLFRVIHGIFLFRVIHFTFSLSCYPSIKGI